MGGAGGPLAPALLILGMFHLHVGPSGPGTVVPPDGGFICISLTNKAGHLFIFIGLALLIAFSEKCQLKLMALLPLWVSVFSRSFLVHPANESFNWTYQCSSSFTLDGRVFYE